METKEMNKQLMLGTLLLSITSFSQAAPITFSTINVTGADMAGLEVIASFQGGGSESFIWSVLSTTLGSSGNDIIDHEGFSGGVSGTGWSLTQQGYSLGEIDSGNIYGAWSFIDNSLAGISQLQINTNGSGIYFDTVTFGDISEDLNGSGQGRPVIGFIGNTEYTDFSFSYGDHLIDEIYGSLTLTFGSPGTSFQFLADTDAANVPEPAALFLFGSGLLGLGISRKKSLRVSTVRELANGTY